MDRERDRIAFERSGATNGSLGTGDMKSDWNARAIENARYYIATTNHATEQQFDASGARDVALFFQSDEELLHRDATVLDIGCGIGRMNRHVAPRVGRLIGLDVSDEMLRIARSRLRDLQNVEFIEGDGRTLAPIDDASIDLIFSHIVFQHLPRRAVIDYCIEARRVLKPGGRFLFQVPESVGAPQPEPDPTDTLGLHYYREADLRRLLDSLAFEWEGCRRHRVSDADPPVDYLRPRVRRPVAER